MGTAVEFSPRRRRDVDTIFLLSDNPADARSIKPLIAFHYAGDLPVYATSEIFSGRIDPRRDQDLNDIRLLATPWALAPPGDLPSAVIAAGGDPLLANWHALGADAFLMHWRLEQLGSQGSLFRGYSGLLGMDAERRFHRELIPALMRAGVPEAM
jgi:outer membrane PBP1 activator LpoA protein